MKNIIIYIIVVLSFFFFVDSVNAAQTFGGLGVNYVYINCSTGGTNCVINSADRSLSGLNSQFSLSTAQYPYALYGWTFNLSDTAWFQIGNIYTLEVTIYDNASSIEYLEGWSYALTSGVDNYAVSNSHADLMSVDITRSGSNITYIIKFKALSEFRYLRVNARAPFNLQDDRVYSSKSDIDTTMFMNSMRYTGDFIIRMVSYTLKSEEDKNQASLDKQDETNDKLDETNQTLDEIKDMDISEEDKELPNDDAYQDYTEAEDDLMDAVNEADLDVLEIAIDEDSSNFVWDTLTDLITSHSLIFGTIVAVLSIGIIKLALGR